MTGKAATIYGRAIAILLALTGLALLAGGVWLATLGGSWSPGSRSSARPC